MFQRSKHDSLNRITGLSVYGRWTAREADCYYSDGRSVIPGSIPALTCKSRDAIGIRLGDEYLLQLYQ